MKRIDRRSFLRRSGATLLGTALGTTLLDRPARAAAGQASRVIFFYFPDGVVGASQSGQPSLWHATGSENAFSLSPQLQPLDRHRNSCLFFRGLSMGPTDSGSHPGGAKKLLTAVDGGNGESIDFVLSRTAGQAALHRHLYLGVMANQNSASGDKHISYSAAGQSATPEDDPSAAFQRLFGNGVPNVPNPPSNPAPDRRRSVIDGALADLAAFRERVGRVEQRKLDAHLDSLRELERRIQSTTEPPPPAEVCRTPTRSTVPNAEIYRPERFPELLRLQTDLMVEAMACRLTQVGVIQNAFHTSDLIMSRFPNTPMHDPGFDMRSHQASHYGNQHDPNHREYADYLSQRIWWVEQFAYLLDQLKARPEGEGTMLDHSVVVLVTEVCDGNTHSHDDMPFVLAGRAGGGIRPGRLLTYDYARHGGLWASVANAMGQSFSGFGDSGAGPLGGVLG